WSMKRLTDGRPDEGLAIASGTPAAARRRTSFRLCRNVSDAIATSAIAVAIMSATIQPSSLRISAMKLPSPTSRPSDLEVDHVIDEAVDRRPARRGARDRIRNARGRTPAHIVPALQERERRDRDECHRGRDHERDDPAVLAQDIGNEAAVAHVPPLRS